VCNVCMSSRHVCCVRWTHCSGVTAAAAADVESVLATLTMTGDLLLQHR